MTLYLTQSAWIFGFTLLGEALQRLLPLPIPAAVYGLVLLFAALCLKIVKVEQINKVSNFLLTILPILFVFNHFFGLNGLIWAQVAADLINSVFALTIYHVIRKKHGLIG